MSYVEAPTLKTDFSDIEKVFDISLYKNIPPRRRVRVIANDLAGIVLEAGDRKLEERINPWYVALTPDGHAINLVSRDDVDKNFGQKTHLAQKERTGALDFYYTKAINAQDGDLIFSFSPPKGDSPYIEARINVAKVRTLYGLKVLECYGIPSKLSPEETLNLANYFLQMSEDKPVSDPEKLREIAILWPYLKDQNVWQFFQENARLDSYAWIAIASGLPRRIKRQAYKAATPIAQKMSTDIEKAHTEREFIAIGAQGERSMIMQGWTINKLECPGVFNSDLLNTTFKIDAMGNFRKSNLTENESQYEKIIECTHCPVCKSTVRAGIKDGHIHCLSCGASAPWTEPTAA